MIRIRPIYFQFLRKIYTMVGTKGLIIVFICFCMFSVILGDDVKVIESGNCKNRKWIYNDIFLLILDQPWKKLGKNPFVRKQLNTVGKIANNLVTIR